MSTRFRSVLCAAAVLVFAAALQFNTLGAEPQGRPNILVIMSDEHNASVLGCYGNNVIRTPNLDGLASRGVVFESCYCNSPLCVPSRLSFTAGKYASRVGAWNNNCRLPADSPSPYPWHGILFGLAFVLAPAYWLGNQAIVQRNLGAKSEWDTKAGMIWGSFLHALIPIMVTFPSSIASIGRTFASSNFSLTVGPPSSTCMSFLRMRSPSKITPTSTGISLNIDIFLISSIFKF